MAITFNDNILNRSPKALDAKQGIFQAGAWRPYSSISEAVNSISIPERYIGLMVDITDETGTSKYWFKEGINNNNLVRFNSAIYEVTASNGLHIDETSGDVQLGGVLINPITSIGNFQEGQPSMTIATSAVPETGVFRGAGFTFGNILSNKIVAIGVSDDEYVTGEYKATIGGNQIGLSDSIGFYSDLNKHTFVVVDGTRQKGIYLGEDYSSNWATDGSDDLVLVNKKWVEDKIAASGGGGSDTLQTITERGFTTDIGLSIIGNLGTSGGTGLKLNNTNSSGYSEIVIDNDVTVSGGGFVFGYGGSSSGVPNMAYLYQRKNAPILFGTNNATRLTIDGAGNVNVANLAGTGDRTVVADASGNLKIATSESNPIDEIVSTTGEEKLIDKNSEDTSDWGFLQVTSAYIGYDVPATSDALLKSARILRFNSQYATIDTLDAEILVGIIDQRRNFLPTRVYPVIGQRDGKLLGIYDAFEYIKFTLGSDAYIKAGEVCFIKVNSISPVITETIGINSVNYDASNKLLYARELTDSLTEVVGKGAMEFVIDTLPYTSIFSTKAELKEIDSSVKSLATTVTNNTIFNDSATGENYKIKVFNGEVILKSLNVERLLVIGNSMVSESFSAQTGDDRAMAASVPGHGFADYMANKFGATLVKMNVFEFEHDYATTTDPYDFVTEWAVTDDYDAIIFSIGANTPSIDSTSLTNLTNRYTEALNYLKSAATSSEIYVHTPFQGDVISEAVQAAATAAYLPFIDTSAKFYYENGSDVFKVGDYYVDSVGAYHSIEDAGIAGHPSDAGHRRIVNTLLPALASSLYTEDSFTINLVQSSGGTISTPNKTWQKDGVVTIRVVPDSGKTISSLTVLDSDSISVTATQRTNSHGVYYTFILPAKDVTVTPVFI